MAASHLQFAAVWLLLANKMCLHKQQLCFSDVSFGHLMLCCVSQFDRKLALAPGFVVPSNLDYKVIRYTLRKHFRVADVTVPF